MPKTTGKAIAKTFIDFLWHRSWRLTFSFILIAGWNTCGCKREHKGSKKAGQARKKSPNRIYASLNTIYDTKNFMSSLLLFNRNLRLWWNYSFHSAVETNEKKVTSQLSQKKALRNKKIWIMLHTWSSFCDKFKNVWLVSFLTSHIMLKSSWSN